MWKANTEMSSTGTKAKPSKRGKAKPSKRAQKLALVSDVSGFPDDITRLMAEYLADAYLSDKSVQCEDFATCHQNVRFIYIEQGRTLCLNCINTLEASLRAMDTPEGSTCDSTDYYTDGDTDEGWFVDQNN